MESELVKPSIFDQIINNYLIIFSTNVSLGNSESLGLFDIQLDLVNIVNELRHVDLGDAGVLQLSD